MRDIWNVLTILILINLSTSTAFGQNSKPENINPCDHSQKVGMDSIVVQGNVYIYKIISTFKLYTKGTVDFYESDILLPDFDSNSDIYLITNILQKIGYIYQTDEFTAFKDCEAREIYYQGLRPLPVQEKYLEKNLIGHFKLEKN